MIYKKVKEGTTGAKRGFSGNWFVIEDEPKAEKKTKKKTKKKAE